RQRIARMDRHVHYRSSLRALFRPVWSLRKDVALIVAVVFGIGINKTADGAVFGSDLWLDAPPASAIARDDDLALNVYAELAEFIVVGRHPVVDINQLTCHIAVDRVCVVGR